MSKPIVKVYGANGELLHSCSEAGCESSWDGYDLATGEPLEARADPGEEWDVSTAGVARLKPPTD